MIFALGIDPGWRLFAWSALSVDLDGRPSVIAGESVRRAEDTTDEDWLLESLTVLGRSAQWVGDHRFSAKGIEDIRGPLQAAQRAGRSSAAAQNGLVMMGALFAGVRGGYIITPQQWRSALGLPSGAEKKQAWESLADLCRVTTKKLGSNEHIRDAACIAYAAGIRRRDEL